MPQTQEQTKIKSAYEMLGQRMKENNLRFVWSKVPQKKYDLEKTLFIPFDASDTEDKNGYGVYLFVHEIQVPKKKIPTLVASATLQLANANHKKSIAMLLNEINLNLPVPGWILDDKDNMLFFKYLFSGLSNNEEFLDVFLTFIVEIVNGIAKSFPLLKEVIEGKPFDSIRDQVGSAFR